MTRDSPSPAKPSVPSVISIVCRICYDCDKEEDLITPCNCKGTVAFVHRSCLETWLGESNTSTCELCHTIFKTERTPKYTSQRSIWRWCRHSPTGAAQGVKSDILACTIITPLAVIITYVCLFSSEYYNQQKFSNVPAARWTSVSLLVMIGIMLIGYYMWVHSVIRMHARMWYNWWQRTCDVRYIPPTGINLRRTGNSNNRNQPERSSVMDVAAGSDYTLSSTTANMNLDVNSIEFAERNHMVPDSATENCAGIVMTEGIELKNESGPNHAVILCSYEKNIV
ncbi:hypothetical protein JTB14_008618 [Gonioctena quinquepunctata]|nr:hypothetical protein JTB14_008618 [Gonioctena quinquepunctata]